MPEEPRPLPQGPDPPLGHADPLPQGPEPPLDRSDPPAPPTAWFGRDAERHLLDAPRHCPRCGASLSGAAGLVVEYWVAEDRVFYCWCRACDWTGTVVHLQRHVGHEAAE